MPTAESQRDSDAGVPRVEDSVDPRPAVRDLPARGRCVLVAQGRGGRRQVQAGNLELHEEDVWGAVRSHHAHARSSSPPVGADASASLRCLSPPVLRLGKSPPLGCPGPPSASGRPTPSGGWPGLSMNGRSVPSEVQALGYVPSRPSDTGWRIRLLSRWGLTLLCRRIRLMSEGPHRPTNWPRPQSRSPAPRLVKALGHRFSSGDPLAVTNASSDPAAAPP